MKPSIPKIFLVALLALVLNSSRGFACNLSDLTFLTLTQGLGQSCTITARLCVGLGVTGAIKGGDQGTTNIAIGFWDPVAGPIVTSFSPNTLVGPPPNNCVLTGNLLPGGTYGTRNLIAYTGSCGTAGYGCTTSAAACGPAQAWCTLLTFTLNRIPDSIRVFGVEGAGNLIGGCFPNPDMLIDLSHFPVIWGEIECVTVPTGVNVQWSTVREVNTDYMIVERADENGEFQTIGQLPAVGTSQALTRYEFFDASPMLGSNIYRIVQVDVAGGSYDSRSVEVDYFKPSTIAWGSVGPNPAAEFVNLSFYSPIAQPMNLVVCDITGKVMVSQSIYAVYGSNAIRLDLAALNRGAYFLSLTGSGDRLTRKIVKH